MYRDRVIGVCRESARDSRGCCKAFFVGELWLEVEGVLGKVDSDVMVSHSGDAQDQLIVAKGCNKRWKFLLVGSDSQWNLDNVGDVSACDGSAVDHVHDPWSL